MAWGLVDQMLSSATNFGGSVLAARTLSSAGFGSFAIVFSLYLISLGLSRAWSSEPLFVLYSGSVEAVQREAVRAAGGFVVAVGAILAILVAVAGLLVRAVTGHALLVLAICMPGLLLQDFARLALIMFRQSRSAAANDLLWLATMLVCFLLSRRTELTPASAVALWAATGAVAGLVGIAQLRCIPSGAVRSWFVRVASRSWRYASEFLLVTGTATTLTIALALVSGLSRAAGFRGAQVLIGPLAALGMAVTIQVVPIMVRHVGDLASVARLARKTSIGLAGVALVWMVVLLLLPESVGSQLVGESWVEARPLVPLVAITYVFAAAAIGAIAGLRAIGDAKASLRVRTIVAPPTVVLGFGGAAIAGPAGAAFGLMLAAAIGIPIWWRTFLKRTS